MWTGFQYYYYYYYTVYYFRYIIHRVQFDMYIHDYAHIALFILCIYIYIYYVYFPNILSLDLISSLVLLLLHINNINNINIIIIINYSKAMEFLRVSFSFTLIRSAIANLRSSRSSTRHPRRIDLAEAEEQVSS